MKNFLIGFLMIVLYVVGVLAAMFVIIIFIVGLSVVLKGEVINTRKPLIPDVTIKSINGVYDTLYTYKARK